MTLNDEFGGAKTTLHMHAIIVKEGKICIGHGKGAQSLQVVLLRLAQTLGGD